MQGNLNILLKTAILKFNTNFYPKYPYKKVWLKLEIAPIIAIIRKAIQYKFINLLFYSGLAIKPIRLLKVILKKGYTEPLIKANNEPNINNFLKLTPYFNKRL